MNPAPQPPGKRPTRPATPAKTLPQIAPRQPEQESVTLARRAAELARPLPQVSALPTGEAVVVVTVSGQQLGFASAEVQEAVTVSDIAPLPGLPEHVLGLTNIRSRVVPVFTLLPLFRLPAAAEPPARLLLLTSEEGEFAVTIDRLDGIRTLDRAGLQQAPSGAADSLIQGVTPEGLLLVAVPALAAELTLSDDRSLSRPLNSP